VPTFYEEEIDMAEAEVGEPMFEPWPKIPRWRREVVVTEKIDGTNAQVHVLDDGRVLAGSRNRYLTALADNFGFYAWVKAHEERLRALGPGRHFGEWWGQGIGRKYGQERRRFSLFNTARWNPAHLESAGLVGLVEVVPVLHVGALHEVEIVVASLQRTGSVAAPGWMKPEGVVIYHTASRTMFKRLLENDDAPKGPQKEEG
jgi:hypothetical protein